MLPSFARVPNTPIKFAKRIGLGNLYRYKKTGYVAGITEMVAHLIYTKPSSRQITKVRFLILAAMLLAPDGSGIFMYLFLWLIIPPNSETPQS